MPVHDFNEAFFQPLADPIDPVKFQETRHTLYASPETRYFSTTQTTALNEFKRSSEFKPFQFQNMQLITALNKWCTDHGLVKDKPAVDATEAREQAAIEAKFQEILTPVNRWCSTKGLSPLVVPATSSPLKTHLLFLFSDDLPQSYNDRASLFFDDGKKSLETLFMLLQHPDIPSDKKKDVMENLLDAIIACADGALTHVFEAKDALIAVLNSQALFEQAKRDVIRQIVIGFHKQTQVAQPPKRIQLLRRYISDVDEFLQIRGASHFSEDLQLEMLMNIPGVRPFIEAIEAIAAGGIAGHEVHFCSAYMDTVSQTYGIAKRNDLFKERIAAETLQYFPIYVNTEISPALVIEGLHSQFELLYQKLHHEMIALFEKKPFIDYPTFQKNIASKIQTQIDAWNKKYEFLCPLDIYAFVTINDQNQVIPTPYDPIKLKARITRAFEQNFLTDDANSKTYIFKFVKAEDAEEEEEDEEDTVEYHHGVVWMVQKGNIVRLTPEAFIQLQIPAFNTPEFLCYWSMFNTMILNFPNHHAELLSALISLPAHEEAVHALTKRPYLLDRLIQQKQVAVLEFLQLNDLLIKDYNIRPSKPVEEDAKSLLTIIRTYHLDRTETSKHLPHAFRIVSDRGTLDELKLLHRVAPYVLDLQGDASKKTALHRAIENKQFDRILYFVNAGARIDIPDHTGKTAQQLFQTIASETDNIRLKLYFKVPPKDKAEKNLWLLLDKYRLETPCQLDAVMRRAAYEGNAADVASVIKLDRAMLDQQESGTQKRTALHIALEKQKSEVVEVLVMAGAKTDIRNGSLQTVEVMVLNNKSQTQILETAVKHAQNKRKILTALETHMKRIESFNGDFEHGFSFHAKSRGLNRQVNYELARDLHTEITSATTANEIAHLLSPSHVAYLRQKIIHTVLSLHKDTNYVERAIHSESLKAVLQLGQQHFPMKPDHSFDLKKAQ